MPVTKKAIHFDLSAKQAFKYGVGTSAWGKVRSFMERNGFKHIQGSGYETNKAMKYEDVLRKIRQLEYELPWFVNVAKDVRLMNVGQYYDALAYIKEQCCSESKFNNLRPSNEEELDVEQEEADVCAASEQLQHKPNDLTQSLGKSER